MPYNYNYVPAQAINSYIWKLLQDRLGWSTADYGGKVPIIPSSRQPEFANYDKPYICYGNSMDASGDDWWNITEVVAYTIYGSDVEVVNHAINLIVGALRRRDESAADINRWIHDTTRNAAVASVFQGLTFQFTTIANDQGPNAPESEGGAIDGMVVVRFGYTVVEDDRDAYVV